MAVAVRGQGGLLVRADPDASDDLLAEPGVDLMEMRGKRMAGWITVEADSVGKAADLRRVKRGVTYARSLPAK